MSTQEEKHEEGTQRRDVADDRPRGGADVIIKQVSDDVSRGGADVIIKQSPQNPSYEGGGRADVLIKEPPKELSRGAAGANVTTSQTFEDSSRQDSETKESKS